MLIDQGVGAAHAWHRAIQAQCEILQALGNLLLAERANDLRDLEKRVLRVLLGDTAPLRVPAGAIVAAREITPPTSRRWWMPARLACAWPKAAPPPTWPSSPVARACRAWWRSAPGCWSWRKAGRWCWTPARAGWNSAPTLDAWSRSPCKWRSARNNAAASRPMRSARRSPATAGASRSAPTSPRRARPPKPSPTAPTGSACYAPSFFLERRAAPDEEEQRNAYQEVLDAMGQRKVIIRTIDVGGDKHLDYLPLPVEENPALGLRGIRLGQARPELLDQQLRALLRVEPLERCRILLPMVSEVDELRAIRRRLGELATQLGIERLPELGVMIEVPSAALLADQLAEHADFLSIGTNDLSQYALAMDRCHAGLADRIDALHPALLRLIAQTCAGAARHGRWVGVCGALASDPLATPVLVGLGVEELSVGPNLVGEIKTRVRQLDAAECRRHAQALLDLGSARAVRDACLQHWPLA